MAPDAEIHIPTGKTLDLDGLKGFAGAFRESFPDWHSTFEELIAEGDRVAETTSKAKKLLSRRRRYAHGYQSRRWHESSP
jgi:predicted ester cyclase